MINKETIEKEIERGQLSSALKSIKILFQSFNKSDLPDILSLTSRLNTLNSEKNQGRVSVDDHNLERNMILKGVISHLEKIKPSWHLGEVQPKVMQENDTRKITILFLAASPHDIPRSRWDEEIRQIRKSLERSKHRENFRLVPVLATQLVDLRRAFLEESPNIVHFSGSSSEEGGIYLVDSNNKGQEINKIALGNFFELFSNTVNCVLLNSCYSESQARILSESIDYVVGIKANIDEDAKITFSEAFYDSLGSGKAYDFAFQLGKVAISLSGLKEDEQPILLKKSK
ncbi:MAG: hypothetical protein MRZ79_25085 [Bacteroidia bacterium]|nr:hypothetical protein [Bacteroidia bacterium]